MSVKILGGRYSRAGFLLGVQDVREDPKFKWKTLSVQQVESLYGMLHVGNDPKYGSTGIFAAGFDYGLRLMRKPYRGLFFQPEIGIQFDTSRTYGVPSEMNFSPGFTVGEQVSGKRPWEYGITFMHLSNGYTERPNYGQDFIMIFAGFKI